MKENPLIIALDTTSSLKALNIVKRFKVTGVAFKIGFELFTSCGPRIVDKIVGHDVRVFLDLKFHDIPNTVEKASKVATQMGVWMFNVHTLGGSEMMTRAKEISLEESNKLNIQPPFVTGVTVLTSHHDLAGLNISKSIKDQVIDLSRLAKKSNLDGVVSSAREADQIRKQLGESFKIVTPGIRLAGDAEDDQKRIVTPDDALKSGVDYLVMGRPILQSKKPVKTIDKILSNWI